MRHSGAAPVPAVLASLAVLVVLVAACAAPRPPAGAPGDTSPPATTPGVTSAPTSTPGATAGAAAFLGTPLTDVRTGEAFTLGGFAGKVVIVQAMAVW